MSEVIGKRQRRQEYANAQDENEPPAKRPRESRAPRDLRRSDHGRRSASRDRGDRLRDRNQTPDEARDDYRDKRRTRDMEDRGHRRDRSRSRDGHRTRRDSPRRRPRSRSRSPRRDRDKDMRRRDRSPRPRASERPGSQVPKIEAPTHVTSSGPSGSKAARDAAPNENDDDEIAAMKRMMGFAGFKSTKNTKVPGNNVGAVRKDKQTTYRQYMNRTGGFNRPLSPSRS